MAELKKWAPSSRIEGDAVRGYMIGKKDGQWVFAPEAEDRIAELEAQLAALTWTPISESNLPKVGDEILRMGPKSSLSKHPTVETAQRDWTPKMLDKAFAEYRRPINPPSTERGAK